MPHPMSEHGTTLFKGLNNFKFSNSMYRRPVRLAESRKHVARLGMIRRAQVVFVQRVQVRQRLALCPACACISITATCTCSFSAFCFLLSLEPARERGRMKLDVIALMYSDSDSAILNLSALSPAWICVTRPAFAKRSAAAARQCRPCAPAPSWRRPALLRSRKSAQLN